MSDRHLPVFRILTRLAMRLSLRRSPETPMQWGTSEYPSTLSSMVYSLHLSLVPGGLNSCLVPPSSGLGIGREVVEQPAMASFVSVGSVKVLRSGSGGSVSEEAEGMAREEGRVSPPPRKHRGRSPSMGRGGFLGLQLATASESGEVVSRGGPPPDGGGMVPLGREGGDGEVADPRLMLSYDSAKHRELRVRTVGERTVREGTGSETGIWQRTSRILVDVVISCENSMPIESLEPYPEAFVEGLSSTMAMAIPDESTDVLHARGCEEPIGPTVDSDVLSDGGGSVSFDGEP
ncbi:hypothetical protein Dimus_005578 [Dionaea muscipula]